MSGGSNTVKPTIYPCPANHMCELTFTMVDEYGDGWNGGYIEIVGTLSDMIYKVELKQGGYVDDPAIETISLCQDTYTFTWVKGEWDAEVGFTITMGDEEVYSLDIAGIHDTFELEFLNYEVDCGASIEEPISENNFSIMPNPATNYFNIEGENIAKVEVYNAIGQMIDVVNVENDNVQVSTENYNNGIYFVKATTTNGQVSVQKVVVSK